MFLLTFIKLKFVLPITTKVVSWNPVHGDRVLDTTLCDKVCQ